MDIIGMISNVAAAVAKFFGYQQQRDAEKNTAAMEAGKERQNEQKATDEINRTIAKADIKATRNDLAE
jgi:hypothetical protein